MKNSIKNTILVAVMVVLGAFLVGCKKDNVEPVVPEVSEIIKKEKVLGTAFRLRVYYTKLNLVDTTYIERVGLGNEKIVETKVVPKGDISITNFREGKYDLVDSTDYISYRDVFEFKRLSTVGDIWSPKDGTLFGGLYKEGYVHKVVVEMSNIDFYDTKKGYDPKRLDMITKRTFIEAFKESTYRTFEANYLKSWSNYWSLPFYYIKDLIDEPVDTDTYLEFKDVPYYVYREVYY